MNTKITRTLLAANKAIRPNLQVVLALLAIILFVLGAGAPDNGGMVGH